MGHPHVNPGDLLSALNDRQLDHLSLGLTHSFGAELSGNQGEPETFFVTLESGRRVALHARTITVKDVWETVKALSE